MPYWSWEKGEDEQEARDILLKHYSSECTVHGGYILTVAIGVFAFLQIIPYIVKHIIYPEVVISFGLGLFVALGLYFVAKTIFWGTLASTVLHARPRAEHEVKETFGWDEKFDQSTLLVRLNDACISWFEAKHKVLAFLVGPRREFWKNALFYAVILVILLVLIYLHIPFVVRN
jgi:hypothetical protein